MKALRARAQLADFLTGVLDRTKSRLFLFDYDGTLSPFHVQRDQALPYPGVREALAALIDSPLTRVVIVSGRPVAQLPSLLALPRLPELWGSHGAERLVHGHYELKAPTEQVRRGLALAAAAAADRGGEAFCETKPAGIALHWRGREEAEVREIAAIANVWHELAPAHGLHVHSFDGGVELRIPGIDKGTVVRSILAEAEPDSVQAYLGDDLTDEDAFRAIAPTGVGILVRSALRETTADAWVVPPAELLQLLETWTTGRA